jgi:hypothetical protein
MEQELANLCQKIYEAGERRIQPTWPWVLIRTIPKEQKFGSLVLPDNDGSSKQHKPLLEGIVLVTWKPHWGAKTMKGNVIQEQIWRESEYKPGDRLLYPHFAGLPVNFLDESKYRLVREWTFDENGGVLGHLHYDGDCELKAMVDGLFGGVQSITLSGR